MKPLCFLATFALCFWFSVAACFAQTVQSGILRWAGDAQGGAPYVLKDPRQPDKTIGFEVDLANALARRMGMTAEFVQNQWDGLIPGLQAGHYDIALNGIEITPEREQEVLFSRPYYATSEQITVREGTANVAGLEDLRGKKVATLKASLAERYLTEFNAAKSANVQIASYDDQNTAYEDLALNRVEAVLMDFPIALYCADPARMKNVGEPIGAMRYGIAIRKKNRALLQRVDVALAETVRSGEVREIYQKWGLWNKETQELFRAQFPDSPNAWTGETGTIGKNLTDYQAATFKPVSFTERLRKYAFVYLPLLLTRGATMTLLVSVCAMIFAIALGMVLAFGNLYGPGLVRVFCRAYVELVRGTPLLVQLYLIYYGLPRIGIQFPPFVAAVLGLGLNYAAYEAENYRAGIQSVARGQMEAARALGMTHAQALRYVVLPQALRLTIAPVTNDFVSLLKDSSIVSIITMVELTKVFGELALLNFDFIGLGLLTAFVYLLLGLPFVYFARYVERRYAPSRFNA